MDIMIEPQEVKTVVMRMMLQFQKTFHLSWSNWKEMKIMIEPQDPKIVAMIIMQQLSAGCQHTVRQKNTNPMP